MSDLIRKMMGQNRGPIGLGNNPSPFQIPYPSDGPQEPEMPEEMMQKAMMDRGMQQYGGEIDKLKSYQQRLMRSQYQQEAAPQMPMIGGPRMGM